METSEEKRSNLSVVSALIWLAAIFLLTAFGLRLFTAAGEEKTIHQYSKENIGQYVTLIGDSISKASIAELEEALPGADIEAVNGITFSEYRDGVGDGGFARLQRHAMRKVVAFLLGTNGGATNLEVSDLVSYVGPERELILMTSYRETADMSAWNAPIYLYENKSDNVHVLDWYIVNVGDPDRLLKADHVHPNEEGRQYFAKMVRHLVLDALELSD